MKARASLGRIGVWDSGEETGSRGQKKVWGVRFGSSPSSVSEGNGCTLGNSEPPFWGNGLAVGVEKGVWGVEFGSPPSFVSEGKSNTLGHSRAGFQERRLALEADRGIGELSLGVLDHL